MSQPQGGPSQAVTPSGDAKGDGHSFREPNKCDCVRCADGPQLSPSRLVLLRPSAITFHLENRDATACYVWPYASLSRGVG
jgi:hypothetical protein